MLMKAASVVLGPLRFCLGLREMTLAETGRVNDEVFCIKERAVNTYVFRGKQGYLMVDAGMCERTVERELGKLGIDPAQVTDIVLTHADGDHVDALGLFKNAGVYMHRDEEQMIDGKTGKFPLVKFKWKWGAYTLFDGDEPLSLAGLEVRVFHAPGHTPGSCSFLIGTDYLATGDHLSYKNGRFGLLPDIFNMDTRAQEVSIRRLPNPETMKFVLTSHYGVIENGRPARIQVAAPAFDGHSGPVAPESMKGKPS